jgi:hypothetical protein
VLKLSDNYELNFSLPVFIGTSGTLITSSFSSSCFTLQIQIAVLHPEAAENRNIHCIGHTADHQLYLR